MLDAINEFSVALRSKYGVNDLDYELTLPEDLFLRLSDEISRFAVKKDETPVKKRNIILYTACGRARVRPYGDR